MDSRSFITVERSRILGTLEPTIGFYTSYAWNPLNQKIDGRDEVLVESLVSGQFLLTLGFFNIFEVGGYLPVAVIRGDPDGPGDLPLLDGDGIGDAGIQLKVQLLDGMRHGLGIALATSMSFASGQENTFLSAGQTVIRPKLILDWDIGSRVGMGVNGGVTLRETQTIAGSITVTNAETMESVQVLRDTAITVGNEINYGFGMSIVAVPERLDVVLETYGAIPMTSGASLAMPIEVLLGLKLYLLRNSFLSIGATYGILGHYGDPSPRAFAGIVFEPTAGDRDRDGIDDDADECPDRPEDKDDFEDADGCPDTDNDMDRIPDIADQCPDDPEDRNGFEDEDGCPDGRRDRDKDGIVDNKDRCPDEREDRDGFQDRDGCPDLDNDADTIPDTQDHRVL